MSTSMQAAELVFILLEKTWYLWSTESRPASDVSKDCYFEVFSF